jgi:hypothetical protein
MMRVWHNVRAEDALPLLGYNFQDPMVRLYAVQQISSLPDDQLALYMLQLTQTLMFEPHHNSPLSEMLLERAIANQNVVAQEMFWLMRSELHKKIL